MALYCLNSIVCIDVFFHFLGKTQEIEPVIGKMQEVELVIVDDKIKVSQKRNLSSIIPNDYSPLFLLSRKGICRCCSCDPVIVPFSELC